MNVLHKKLLLAIQEETSRMGLDAIRISLSPCPDRTMGDIATPVALAASRILKRPPLAIAEEIAAGLVRAPFLDGVAVARPGYLNIRFSGPALLDAIAGQRGDPAMGVEPDPAPMRMLIDFGGPNIAKTMHAGHMRSLFIGESLRRILRSRGHDVVSDIHLGDWGLPMGMVLDAVVSAHGGFPDGPGTEAILSGMDLDRLYPDAAEACKASPERMERARIMTSRLQEGDPQARALWSAIRGRCLLSIKAVCERMGARFDLWLGESDSHSGIAPMLDRLETGGTARREGDALVVDLATEGDASSMPSLPVSRGDGSALYATTDLATLVARRRMGIEKVLYVVDARQSLHFSQVARVSELGGLAPEGMVEHVGFGTVNGPGGRPLRTRDGGTTSLVAMLDAAAGRARSKLVEDGHPRTGDDAETERTAEDIGMAALRIGDLSSPRMGGYALDIEKACLLEGRTGPHLLYAAVRLASVLRRTGASGTPMAVSLLGHPCERELAEAVLGFGSAVEQAADEREPSILVGWAFDTSAAIGRFWSSCPVAAEEDADVRASRIGLCQEASRTLRAALLLLGCRIPERM